MNRKKYISMKWRKRISSGFISLLSFFAGVAIAMFFFFNTGRYLDFNGAPYISSTGKLVTIPYKARDIRGINSLYLIAGPLAEDNKSSLPSVKIPVFSLGGRINDGVAHIDPLRFGLAGKTANVKLASRNNRGDVYYSKPIKIVFPNAEFSHPLARILMAAKEKLYKNPVDLATRREVITVMATVAYKPANFNMDPVVFLSLRNAAIRFMVSNDAETVSQVRSILLQSANRIEMQNKRNKNAEIKTQK
ncbi:MAG: DUF4175 family protein [Alphaproteobacteria bacterium]|nr:DUF4175 family protein [Alphaproteobacteria bacterium]MCL2505653.1 DUF4175 family protein [Alphaproteobacteria bacterium]